MKKVFFKYYQHLQGYNMFENAQTCNFILQEFFDFLRAWGDKGVSSLHQCRKMSWEWLHLSKIKDQDKVYLWNSDYIKQKARDLHFNTIEERDLFSKSYSAYSAKRWYDMPILEMSLQNYEDILTKWNDIIDRKPEYMIFSQDDAGYVDLIGKDALSEQDLADMKIEHEKYLKYQAAWEKYDNANPDRSEVWRSPADDEYEADWQKYLDEPLDKN